uniref:Uncharacterized protein n=1 Tax=Amphora coffeiformis TaxID=265554 RepID=A0A7S3L340_9STRA
MAPSARSILVGIANAVALFMVIGVIAHGYMDEAKPSTNVVSMVEHEADLPSVAGTARHLKSSKGGKGSAIECVDADATPAPTKGKGKGKKMSMKMSSKGKGSSSEAPVSMRWITLTDRNIQSNLSSHIIFASFVPL